MTALSGSDPDIEIDIPVANRKKRYYSLNILGSQNVHPDYLDLYMTPILEDESSVDALFISSAYNATFLFQMTVSRDHPINFRGLDEVVKNLPVNAQKKICIVFIVPAKDIPGDEYKGIQSRQKIDADRFEGSTQYVDISAVRWT